MATETLMTLRQLSIELGIPYAHIWESARVLGLIECQKTTSQTVIVPVDAEKMAVFRKAVDIRNRYGIIFPQALRMALDGWSAPTELQDA